MPTLHWIGKEKVINHHQEVPYRVLQKQYEFNTDSEPSGNKIIHGDNLEALKSLLPEYEGRVNCIYIDPPYNTGNENWVYNDNVNHPKIKKWLGDIVGKEGEDLSRHDKWLCMMYPRLKLLHKLLAKDGAIFISIDDNEYQSLKFILDEIFGRRNHLTTFTWRTDGNFDNQAKIKVNHEYIVAFSKEATTFEKPKVVDPNVDSGSKLFKSEIINTVVKNGPKNPVSDVLIPKGFPANFKEGFIQPRVGIWPEIDRQVEVRDFSVQNDFVAKSGWSAKNILLQYIENGLKPVLDTKNQATEFHFTSNGAIENVKRRDAPSHVVSSLYNLGSTQNMSSELKEMGFNFDYPKPVSLLSYLLKIISKENSIILDSFAGSGTTAHAVLNLNKEDGGNRKFILIEMEDYADSITAERVKRVIQGYGIGAKAVEGTGGDFGFYDLGPALFDAEGNLNEAVALTDILAYIWYSETRTKWTPPVNHADRYYLGILEDTTYYFIYEPDSLTTLDFESLSAWVTQPAEQYICYADNCLLPEALMQKHRIIFKKIPRDITRF